MVFRLMIEAFLRDGFKFLVQRDDFKFIRCGLPRNITLWGFHPQRGQAGLACECFPLVAVARTCLRRRNYTRKIKIPRCLPRGFLF